MPPFSAITFGDGSPSLTFADILPLIQVVEANEVFGADTGAGEVLTGTEGMDSIFAETGTNVIDALGGDDEVYGGAGFDTITGGAGSDFLTDEGGGVEFRFAPGFGQDEVVSYRAQTETSAVVFEAGIDPEDVTVEALGTDIVLRVAGTTDTISILYNDLQRRCRRRRLA